VLFTILASNKLSIDVIVFVTGFDSKVDDETDSKTLSINCSCNDDFIMFVLQRTDHKNIKIGNCEKLRK